MVFKNAGEKEVAVPVWRHHSFKAKLTGPGGESREVGICNHYRQV
ncbi:MAG: hypothetical protein ACI8W8_004832, partial [Rhodothermales bacterium]